jgi:hypothetical protein
MIDVIAMIRGVEHYAPTVRGLAMLALRPLSVSVRRTEQSRYRNGINTPRT